MKNAFVLFFAAVLSTGMLMAQNTTSSERDSLYQVIDSLIIRVNKLESSLKSETFLNNLRQTKSDINSECAAIQINNSEMKMWLLSSDAKIDKRLYEVGKDIYEQSLINYELNKDNVDKYKRLLFYYKIYYLDNDQASYIDLIIRSIEKSISSHKASLDAFKVVLDIAKNRLK